MVTVEMGVEKEGGVVAMDGEIGGNQRGGV